LTILVQCSFPSFGFNAGSAYTATSLKKKLGYDDSLDVFGVHGVGGIVGALLAGVCASEVFGGSGTEHGSIGTQVWYQLLSVLVTIGWSATVSMVAFFLVDKIIGTRVSPEVERSGLDLADHEEQAYEIF
jgi:Amt family ammonium transporter